MSVTCATPTWHECDTSKTRATRVGYEWGTSDTSATWTTLVRHKWKILILITTRMRTYFHTPVFIIWQVKDYKEKNNFILRTTYWKNLAPCQNVFQKCVTKTVLCTQQKHDVVSTLCVYWVMAKAVSKTDTLDCTCKWPCTLPLSYP